MASWRGSNVTGAIAGEAEGVDPSTLGDAASADGPGGPDGDDTTTPMVPFAAVGPAGAPGIRYESYPAIQDGVSSMCDGGPVDVALKNSCEEHFGDLSSGDSRYGDSRRC